VDKRYQVFVSSTFEDLREERAAAISALLQIDCFPAGMELFPAADDDSITLIKSVIEDSDYYLVILGGRYGSLDAPAEGATPISNMNTPFHPGSQRLRSCTRIPHHCQPSVQKGRTTGRGASRSSLPN
jgi:hypothetical protein